MNKFIRALSTVIKDVTEVDVEKFTFASTLLLLRVISCDKYKTQLKGLVQFTESNQGQAIHDAIHCNGYFLKNLKLLWLNSLRYSDNDMRGYLISKCDKFKVTRSDALLILALDVEQKDNIRAKMKGNFLPRSLKKLDELMSHVSQETQVYTIKFVYKKHKFITDSHFDLSPLDLAGELRVYALQDVLRQFPTIHHNLHAVNVAKRTIKNHGQNMCKKYGIDSTKAVQNRHCLHARTPDGGFISNKISLDIFGSESNGPSEVSVYVGLDGGIGTTERGTSFITDSLDVRNLKRKFRGQSHIFISLISGKYNPLFSQWLMHKGLSKKANDELFDFSLSRNINRYIEYARRFCTLTKDRASFIIDTIKQDFKTC